jgi:hypothetical protein
LGGEGGVCRHIHRKQSEENGMPNHAQLQASVKMLC